MWRSNPFDYVNTIAPSQLRGRDRVLHTLKRAITDGQSTAITGTSRSGKTSILNYLCCEKLQHKLYGKEQASRLIFSYVDALGLEKYHQTQFWKAVLKQLQEKIAHESDSALSKAYQTCQTTNFCKRELEKLFLQLKQAEWRFVLMLDGFDALSGYPLGNQEFFSVLRQLATQNQGALVLITTANAYLHEVFSSNKITGSPFNFLTEQTLHPLPEADIEQLLRQGDKHFTEEDYRFIKNLAGGHPYLLQLAASVWWQNYEGGDEIDILSWQQAERDIYNKAKETLKTIWHVFTLRVDMLKTFTSVALIHLAALPGQPLTLTTSMRSQLIDNINRLRSEREYLEKSGLIVYDNTHESWRVLPRVFLTFVKEEKLTREVSGKLNDSSYEKWLTSQTTVQNEEQQPRNLGYETKVPKPHRHGVVGPFPPPWEGR